MKVLSMFYVLSKNHWYKYFQINKSPSWSNLCEKLKICIKIQYAVQFLIKMCKILFWLITQEPLDMQWMLITFLRFLDKLLLCAFYTTFQNSVDYFDVCTQNINNFALGAVMFFLKVFKGHIAFIQSILWWVFHLDNGIQNGFIFR